MFAYYEIVRLLSREVEDIANGFLRSIHCTEETGLSGSDDYSSILGKINKIYLFYFASISTGHLAGGFNERRPPVMINYCRGTRKPPQATSIFTARCFENILRDVANLNFTAGQRYPGLGNRDVAG